MNSRKCEACNVDVHRASFMKHLRSEKHMENMKQNEMIKPEWLFQEPTENKINKIYSPKTLRQLARANFRLNDRQINRESARRLINPYYFTDRILRVGFEINLDSHNLHHTNFNITNTPNHS